MNMQPAMNKGEIDVRRRSQGKFLSRNPNFANSFLGQEGNFEEKTEYGKAISRNPFLPSSTTNLS